MEEWRLWWIFAYLSPSGECRSEVMSDAWTFFHGSFLDTSEGENLTIAVVTQKLFGLVRSSSENSNHAELCLRGYISNQIRFACDRLAAQFGEQYGFCARDLWSFVLNDVPPDRMRLSPTGYQSTADRILETFDPDRGSLNTYIDRLVKRQPELKQCLLQHGVYLATAWGILNNTTVHKLEDVLSQFYNKTAVEVRQACQLLRAFHAVYSRNRIQDRTQRTGGGRCKPPTTEQLEQMTQFIHDRGNTTFPSETNEVLGLLKDIAADLRHHHIYKKTGNLPPGVMVDPQFGYDIPDNKPPYEGQGDDGDREIEEFLRQYRQQLLHCLEKAIDRVIEVRVEGFRKQTSKKDPHKGDRKAKKFLAAMELHQCDRRSMEEIALTLGLKDQPTVSKLLKLKAFRTDVRHYTLQLLRDRVIELAGQYLDPDRLQHLDRLLDEVLGERIDEMFGSTEHILADRICRYLDRR
ncbi:hypothetical protein [Zarconia navalis]|uniref:hypothetical protein n=1 Tax=Zarconia navalis TaxID=2992134 RepID=UPI0021F8467B|nr:hypothetical protein [Zarconia navalis]